MGRLHRPVFQQNTIYLDMGELYVDFKAQRNALYHWYLERKCDKRNL